MVRCRKLPTAFQLAHGHRLPPGARVWDRAFHRRCCWWLVEFPALHFTHLIGKAPSCFSLSQSFLARWEKGHCTVVRAGWGSLQTHTELASGHCCASGAIKCYFPRFGRSNHFGTQPQYSNFGVGSYTLRHMFFIAETQEKTIVFRIQKLRNVHSYQKLR